MRNGKPEVRIVVIIGSVRPGNATGRAARLVVDELARHENVVVDVIDPADFTLPLPGQTGHADVVRDLHERAAAADGLVLTTPEYHGSYSSVIKLVIENLGYPSVMAGKPVALLGVASGEIGAIKALEHLRSVLSHIGVIVLPSPASVAAVHKAFDEAGTCLDPKVEERVRGLATKLLDFLYRHVCPGLALEEMVRAEADALQTADGGAR